jgi:iron complex outermembrane receptor protein
MNRQASASAARALLAGMFACISLCWAALTLAQETARQYDIDIGELSLARALQTFSRQTDLQYLYFPTDEEEEQRLVGPIKGRFTTSEVLAKLLPAGFTFEWINARTISIVSPPVNAPPGGVKEAVAGKDQQRLELTKEQQLSMANGGGESGSARGPYAFDWKVLVEASRIFDDLDLDVPRTVLDRGDIDALGVSTVTDLLRYVTQQPHTMSESYLGDGTQFADLRGLGFDTTLVLINGRRTVATASSLTVNAFDLNSIPLGAVERVEIVSDSMSAIHGADAIGGVLNIVLREDIPEPRLDIDYGAAAGGAVERHATFSISGRSSRARGSIVLDYFGRSPLLGRERDRWNNQDFRRFGSIDWRSPIASPGNVRSTTLENLPGLPSSFAGMPAVSAGMQLTPADFLPTAGQENVESLFRYVSVLAERTGRALVAQGEYGLGSNLSAFGEFLYVDREDSQELEPSALVGALVPATNPHNPFGTDVLVDVLLTELGPRTFSRRGDMIRAVGGARGQLEEWAWETSIHKTRDDDVTVRANDVDPLRVAGALTATDTDESLNPFGGGAANGPGLLESLLASPARSHFRTEMLQATAYLRGPLFTLPAGQVELLVGGERRKEDVQYDITLGPALSGSHQRFVTAAFGEVRLPIVNAAARIPAIHDLSVVLSGRFDGYSDVGDSFNPEYALAWRPIAALTVRTSLSQSFRPPPLFDLYMPLVEVVAPIADPARNGEFAFSVLRVGGNEDLKPANADSFTTGLQFAPSGASGLRIAATYWRIRVNETIGIPLAEGLLADESRFADRIVRGEPSAADIAAGIPGPLELVDIRRLNYGSIHTSGIDFSASMVLDMRVGRFIPELSATWVHDFTTSDLVDGPDVSRVGVANLQGSVARWRAVAGLAWSREAISISAKARYVPSYDDVDTLGRRTGRSVDAQTLVDAQIAVDLSDVVGEDSMWRGFEIRAGVSNLLDEEPPFAEAGWFTGYDPSQGDLRQRFGYVKLTKRF